MTEDTVREFAHVYKDAVKVEGSLEVRKLQASTSDWQRSPRARRCAEEITAVPGRPAGGRERRRRKALAARLALLPSLI